MTRRLARWLAVATVALAAVGSGVGVAVAAFSAATSNGPSTFTAKATFPPIFVRNVGTAACGTTSNSVTAPAGGIPGGRTLIVHLVLRGGGYANAVGATDTRGNAYRIDVDSTNAGSQVRTVLLSTYVATPLLAGDTITASHGSSSSSGIGVDELRRIPGSNHLDRQGTANGSSASPSATTSAATRVGDAALYGAFGNVGTQTVQLEATGWTVAHDLTQNCGGPANRARNHAAYRIVAALGTYIYAPTLSGSTPWAAAIGAYSG